MATTIRSFTAAYITSELGFKVVDLGARAAMSTAFRTGSGFWGHCQIHGTHKRTYNDRLTVESCGDRASLMIATNGGTAKESIQTISVRTSGRIGWNKCFKLA